MEDQVANTTQDRAEEISLVDLLVVLLKKRRLILGITLCGVILSAVYVLGGRIFPAALGGTYSARVQVLVLEDGLGPLAASLTKSQSFKDSLEKSLDTKIKWKDLDKLTSVTFDQASRILVVVGRGGNSEKAMTVAMASYDALKRLSGLSSVGRYKALSEYLAKTAAALTEGDKNDKPFRGSQSLLVAAANARSKRITAEGYFSVSTEPSEAGDLSYKVLDAMVRSYRDAEKEALDRLSAQEVLAGALSASTLQALNLMVAGNLLAEVTNYKNIPKPHNEYFTLIAQRADEGPTRPSLSKTLVLGLFGAFFVGIVLAFMSNAWDGIKADPVASRRIREALGRPAKS